MVFKILEKSSVVIHDLKLLGDSTVAHQIDVVFEVNGNRRRVVLECKDFDISGASVDLDILRSFRSVIEDRQADEGIVVTSNAYTREAQKYAKSKNIKLAILRQITPEDLEGLIQKIIIDMHVQSNHNHQADLHIEAADHDLFQAELARVGLAGGGGIHSGDPVYVVLGSEKTQFTEFLSSQVSSQPAAKTENGRWQVRTASNGRSLQVNDGPLIRFGGVVTTYDIVIEKFPMEISSNRIAEMIVSGLGSDDIIIFDDQIKAFQIDEDTGEIRGAAANQA
jgi:hypothetical protein